MQLTVVLPFLFQNCHSKNIAYELPKIPKGSVETYLKYLYSPYLWLFNHNIAVTCLSIVARVVMSFWCIYDVTFFFQIDSFFCKMFVQKIFSNNNNYKDVSGMGITGNIYWFDIMNTFDIPIIEMSCRQLFLKQLKIYHRDIAMQNLRTVMAINAIP